MSVPWAVFTFTCLIILYSGGCQAAVGDACPNGNECTATGEICHTDGGVVSCACNTNYYANGTTCVQKLELSVTCNFALTGVTQCSDTNAECASDNVCRCKATYFDSNGHGTTSPNIDGNCIEMSALTVTGVGTSSVETSSVLISWTAPVTYSAQVNRYVVMWMTTAGSSGTQASGTVTSSTVTGLTSNTQYSFKVQTWESGSRTTEQSVTTSAPLMVTTKSQVGDVCGSGCSDTNSECSSGDKCTCKSGYYDSDGNNNNIGGTCTLKLGLSVTCSNALTGVTQCSDTNAECASDNVCRCKATYFDSNGHGTTSSNIDGNCIAMSALTVTGVGTSSVETSSVLISWTAPVTYSAQVNRYVVMWMTTAGSSGTQASGTVTSSIVTGLTSNTQYSFKVQTWESGSRTTEQSVTTSSPLMVTTKSQVGDVCGSGCSDTNSECSSGDKCTCKSGYYDSDGNNNNIGGTCTLKLGLSVTCSNALTGVTQCSDTNAECASDNVCRCKATYFDSNGHGTTSSNIDGNCIAMSALKVTGVTVSTQSTDTAIVGWTPPADTSQVSQYQVMWTPAKSGSSMSTIVAKESSTVTITGFTSGSTYTFSVKTLESGSQASSQIQDIEADSLIIVLMKSALSVTCNTTLTGVTQCSATNAECATDSVCRCKLSYFDSNGYGTGGTNAGGTCTSMSALKVTGVTVSTQSTDTAIVGWTPPADTSQVSRYQVMWTPTKSGSSMSTNVAKESSTVTITGFTSGSTYTFSVKTLELGSQASSRIQDIEADLSMNVSMKVGLSVACGTGSPVIVCEDTTTAACVDSTPSGMNVCRCNEDYFDSNGYSNAGGTCTAMSTLTVTSLEVGVEGTSTVTISWVAPAAANQVNRYEIHWSPMLDDGTLSNNTALITSARLTGFTTGRNYTFFVKTIEDGSRASSQEVKTPNITITMNAGLTGVCGGSILCSDSNSECANADDAKSTVCRCKAGYFDSNGYSSPGGMCIPMTTLAVTGLTLTKEGTNTANISWNPPSQYTDQVRWYEVHWSPATNISGNTIHNATLSTSVHLVGFIPGTSYNFTVYSYEVGSRVGESRIGTQAEITMKPATPTGFTETDVDGPTIILSWKAPQGFSSGYSVTTTPLLGTTNVTTENITYSANVVDGQRYNISITALSDAEQSDPLTAAFRTVSKTPGSPTSVNCKDTTDNSITLTWTKTSSPNGDIQHYMITKNPSTAVTINTTTAATEYSFSGLEPATVYVFTVATVNDAQSPHSPISASTSELSCTTSAAMSKAPSSLVESEVNSRDFTLKWTEPNITYGALKGYRLTVKTGDTCVKEVIFSCSTAPCPQNFEIPGPASCQTTQPVTIQPGDIQAYTYPVTGLLPYINYSATVVAVNEAGDGYPSTVYVLTDQEVPQSPTNLNAVVLNATEVNVSWSMSGYEPGPTNYTLYIIVQTPETRLPQVIPGFSNITYRVMGLEEFRTYSFNLTASTVVGSAAYQGILPSVKTDAAAPNVVSQFMVVRPSGPDYTKATVSWELPSVLERNCNITHYKFQHNTTGGSFDSEPVEIPVSGDPSPVNGILVVEPLSVYVIKAYAVGVNDKGEVFNGRVITEIYTAPAGPPPMDTGGTVIPDASNTNILATQTQFTLSLSQDFFTNAIYGTIVDYAVVVCKQASCTTLEQASKVETSDYLTNLDGWKTAKSKGFPDVYRAMSKVEFATALQGSSTGRRKRATTFVIVIGGGTSCDSSTDMYCNGPLDAGVAYVVKAVVCTQGGCTLSSLYGPYSTQQVPEPESPIGPIVGGVIGGLVAAILVIVLVIFIMRRRRSRSDMYKERDDDEGQELPQKDIPRKRPVAMENFPEHVTDLLKDSKLKFAQEYEDVKELSPKHPVESANEEGNKLKNRYVNILPFDHSRVKMNPTDLEDPTTDFINANYIPGYNSPREYIASQGPIPCTIDDFWRMIWEQHVSLCVMLTLTKEDGRIKCEMYWPSERNEPKQYGDIVVETTSDSTVNTYDFRIFKLTQGDETRTLKHFHFLNWKDFSANVQNDVMIDFIQNVRGHIQPPDREGPLLIHCSAGVGRTGTYIALDQLIQFIEENDFSAELDIFDLVLSMRNYRVFMVQTEQQYVFIHTCARDLIERKKARLLEQDEDGDLYVNRAFEPDQEENLYQNVTITKTEL